VSHGVRALRSDAIHSYGPAAAGAMGAVPRRGEAPRAAPAYRLRTRVAWSGAEAVPFESSVPTQVNTTSRNIMTTSPTMRPAVP
jgi:hypothetical protein